MHTDVCQVQTVVIRVPILKNWSKMTKGRIKSTIVKLTLAPATPRHQLSFYILPFIKPHSPKPPLAPCASVIIPDPFPPVLALPTSLALLPIKGVHPSLLHAHSLGACKTRLDRRIWWTTQKKKNYLVFPKSIFSIFQQESLIRQ